jgi:hypothetical protein
MNEKQWMNFTVLLLEFCILVKINWRQQFKNCSCWLNFRFLRKWKKSFLVSTLLSWHCIWLIFKYNFIPKRNGLENWACTDFPLYFQYFFNRLLFFLLCKHLFIISNFPQQEIVFPPTFRRKTWRRLKN